MAEKKKKPSGSVRDEANEQIEGEAIETAEQAAVDAAVVVNPGKCPTCGRDR
jgi:hypothetical protein